MKKASVLLFVSFLSLSAFAQKIDATPAQNSARKAALNYAMDNVFGEILDESSSLSIVKKDENTDRFVFLVTAHAPPQTCIVQVVVSKETGMVFNDDPMSCQ